MIWFFLSTPFNVIIHINFLHHLMYEYLMNFHIAEPVYFQPTLLIIQTSANSNTQFAMLEFEQNLNNYFFCSMNLSVILKLNPIQILQRKSTFNCTSYTIIQ